MSEKPRLIKPKKTKRLAGRNVFGGIYIGVDRRGGMDASEIIRTLLKTMGVPIISESKKYKGELIDTWKVTSEVVKIFYRSPWAHEPNIVVCIEINANLQWFRLMDPDVAKKAKLTKGLNRKMREAMKNSGKEKTYERK